MYWLFLRRGRVEKYDRPHLRLNFWKLKEILAWPMPFFPLTTIILLTLGFYLDFLSQIFPKLCTFEITGRFLCFHVDHLLLYSVVRGKVGLFWNVSMSFYPINF